MLHNNRAQTAIEFVIVVGLLTVFSTLFIITIHYQSSTFQTHKTLLKLNVIAENVQQELLLAASVKPGYNRSFTIPEKLFDKDYNITIQSGYVIITQGELEASKPVPQVVGNIVKGVNTIRNIGGVLYLN